MIAWTIEAAKNSGCFDRVLVSTDDSSIAEVAVKYGAEVPFLRTSSADDFAPVSEATVAALRQAANYWGEDYRRVVQLMPNCPIRTAEDIVQAVEVFSGLDRDFQISCFKYGWMNPWWAVMLEPGGYPKRVFPEAAQQRSQDLPGLFCPTGAIWIAKVEKLLEHKTFYGPNHVFEPMPWVSAVDIDDYDDLIFAKSVFAQATVR